MAMIQNFNRIISVHFFSRNPDGSKGTERFVAIKCPSYGRKPNIELSGLWTSETSVPTFNLKIKNLYMENIQNEYPFIEVEAGYYGQTVKFGGTISYMFTETPGPESSTVIMCQFGNLENWLDSNVKISEPVRFQFSDVLSQIAKALGMQTKLSSGVKNITSQTKFDFNGMAKDALTELKKHFTQNIVIVPNGSEIQAHLDTESSDEMPLYLPFLTSTPQLIGGTDNVVSATVMTLWNPKVMPGTLVSFNTNYYSTSLVMQSQAKTLKMKVISVNFHFSTTKGGNEMTLVGQVKK